MAVERIKQYLSSLDFPWDLNQLPSSAYLVGGSVRDALLERHKQPLDLDFVLPSNTIALAKEIANLYSAGFVVLDREREIARVVFPQGTLDFALQEGSSLATDLKRRDFTINAIAFNIATQEIVDPLNGLADLEQKTLRMVSVHNLEDDPLRLLRAYRQAAQLNLTIEQDTRKAICDRVALLSTVAAERVQAELNYMLATSQGNKWLKAAVEDNLLQVWLPSIDLDKIEQLDRIDEAIKYCFNLGLNSPELSLLSKLATLVSANETTAELELTRLKYSRSQIRTVSNTVKHLLYLQNMTRAMSLREQYFWFQDTKDIFPVLIVRAIATDVSSKLLEPLIRRYLDSADSVFYPRLLVTGNDLIEELKLKPSAIIGKLLTEIQVAQIESKIGTRQEALEYAQFLLKILI
ncbi:MAG: CCA tRNA nucleotidyltransferase [Cyanobacteria bacterium P01_G01_bin.19]